MFFKPLLSSLLVVFVLVSSPAAQAQANRRVALIIGNSNYQHLTDLNNPASDAKAIKTLLETHRFEVKFFENVDFAGLKVALDDFRAFAQGAGLALVYYAGHGMEANGEGVIAPVDMPEPCASAQLLRTIALQEVFTAIQGAQNKIVLLDGITVTVYFTPKLKFGHARFCGSKSFLTRSKAAPHSEVRGEAEPRTMRGGASREVCALMMDLR